MRLLVLGLMVVSLSGMAEEVCIRTGLSKDEAVAQIKKNSGSDIGPKLEMVAPGGGPVVGLVWEFKDYDAIIELSVKDGKVASMIYWTKKDFSKDKSHRAESERPIIAMRLDTKTKTVTVEKVETLNKPGGPRPTQ